MLSSDRVRWADVLDLVQDLYISQLKNYKPAPKVGLPIAVTCAPSARIALPARGRC